MIGGWLAGWTLLAGCCFACSPQASPGKKAVSTTPSWLLEWFRSSARGGDDGEMMSRAGKKHEATVQRNGYCT